MHASVCKSEYQACGHQCFENQLHLRVSDSVLGRRGTIASEGSNIPRVHWIRADRLYQVRDSVQSNQCFPRQCWAEISVSISERGYTLVQLDQQFSVRMEEMVRQLQESRVNCQATTANRSIRFTPSSSPPRVPILGETVNVQDDTDIPTGPTPPPILPQLSKAPTPTNLPDSPFEFETDPTTLKVSKLEKLFKKSQGAHSILDIEDGYTDSAVTLSDRFKMLHIDHFDGSRDPMVHLRLFSDILRPMGLSRLQKLSLFGRTLSSVAAIWYAKFEDSVKRSWKEMVRPS
ncbi:hypothetical protein ACSBR1_012796 [Camellia fascicularis]